MDSGGRLLSQLARGDLRARIWIFEETGGSTDGDYSYTLGHLMTVSRAEPYVSVSIYSSLNDPDAELAPGLMSAEIVTETTTPISFLFN